MADIKKVNNDSWIEKTTDNSVDSEKIKLDADKIEEKTEKHEDEIEKIEWIVIEEKNQQLNTLTNKLNEPDVSNEKAKKRIIDMLIEKHKGRNKNVLFTAIEYLEDPDQIREFFEQYAETLISIEPQHRKIIAKDNIIYVIGYFSDASLKKRRSDALWGLPNHLESIAARRGIPTK